jgi:predicted nicotinamide N-methyase
MGRRSEIRSHGVRLLLSNHKHVRRLKREYYPSIHGNKVWPSSWLLIDYFQNIGLMPGQKILDVGCGWGLSGIYCAKNHTATVTGVDGDEEVYPYLQLMAKINHVTIHFLNLEIDKIGRKTLEDIDMIIGSDICFYDELVDPLRRLINRARKALVSQIYLSDPGRSPFDQLSNQFINRRGVELMDWSTTSPVKSQGRILKLSNTA